MTKPEDIIQFWFHDISPKLWFKKDDDFDETLRTKFSDIYAKARIGETCTWRETAEGRLAEIIVLDQFPRNMFRDKPESFASDVVALVLSQEAVGRKFDEKLLLQHKPFMYMPFMHSESPVIHQQALKLFSQTGLELNLDFEILHSEIIKKFGRYPHRNKILNRVSTPAEILFLQQPGSGF